ncbi:MAG: hypothetical protein R3335_12730, partial [Anaerolineales bacterium]|nr:hypothetical protein [Anaerolineales bacterium]
DVEIDQALENFNSILKPAGMVLISTRDYDQILRERPSGTYPKKYTSQETERVVFQVWEWQGERVYSVEQFLLVRVRNRWDLFSVKADYRAWTRAELSGLFTAAGFHDVQWTMPEESGYFQPILTARAGSG